MNGLRMCGWALGALLLAGCAAATAAGPAPGRSLPPAARTGHVTGRLLMAGGPLGPGGQQPGTRPIPGTVTFTEAGHQAVTAAVTAAGRFSVWLPPGRYQVAGRSPTIESISGSGQADELTCSPRLAVTVRAGYTATTTVVCAVP